MHLIGKARALRTVTVAAVSPLASSGRDFGERSTKPMFAVERCPPRPTGKAGQEIGLERRGATRQP